MGPLAKVMCCSCIVVAMRTSAQDDVPRLGRLIEAARPSIVKIVVIVDSNTGDWKPQDLAGCNGGIVCTLGTGFFVNEQGYVVTAFHVVDGYRSPDGQMHPGIKQIQELLNSKGINSNVFIGTATAQSVSEDTRRVENTMLIPASVYATDPEHDLAVLHITGRNPFVAGPPNAAPINEKPDVAVVKLRTAPAIREGEEVYACGYPMSQPGMISTTGIVASGGNLKPLLRAVAAGFDSPQSVYELDLRINPGNSGGPVFGVSDQAVVGVAVEGLGSLGIAVPAYRIAEFLSALHINWTPAKTGAKLN